MLTLLVFFSSVAYSGEADRYSREQFSFTAYTTSGALGFYTPTECGELEIDHVVSLKDAWESGAKYWTSEQKQAFANDRTNHVFACKSVNRSKGSATPMTFKKRSQDRKGRDYRIPNWCLYLDKYVAVKKQYDLTVSEATTLAHSKCKTVPEKKG